MPNKDDVRIGVYLCGCNNQIGNFIDLDIIKRYCEQLNDDVVAVDIHDTICSRAGRLWLKNKINERAVTRVVLGACSPITYEKLIAQALEFAGMNQYLYEHVNLREHCAWVVRDKSRATEKAKVLISMAIAKSRLLEPLSPIELQLIPRAMVIGAGVAGIRAAIELANKGYKTFLIERSPTIGGRTYKLSTTHPTSNCGICCIHDCKSCRLTPKLEEVYMHENIELMTNTEVVNISGHIGRYTATLRAASGKEHQETVGTVIIATGSQTFDPRKIPEYGYQYEDVVSSVELEELFVTTPDRSTQMLRRPSDGKVPACVNFVQCVGSRRELGNLHCSLVCCNYAIGQARKIKQLHPSTEVYIHYIDLRAPYKGFEEYYKDAQALGVRFMRGRVAEVQKRGDKLALKTEDVNLGEIFNIESDLVVLSVGQEPSDGSEQLARWLNQDLDVDGFFKDVNLIQRGGEEQGVFVAGCAQGPKGIRYSVADGKIAAELAIDLLARGKLSLEPIKSVVVDNYCDGCAYCIEPCPYDAITLLEYMRGGAIKKTVEINPGACKGCGICVATCPKKGIFVNYYKPEQLSAMLDTMLSTAKIDPLIVCFACNWCGYPVADAVGNNRLEYWPGLHIIRVRCAGMVHPNLVIEALTKGADGVLILGCYLDEEMDALVPSKYKSCHYKEGNVIAKSRANAIKLMLEDFGLEPERFRLERVTASEYDRFIAIVTEMTETLRKVGSNPYKS